MVSIQKVNLAGKLLVATSLLFCATLVHSKTGGARHVDVTAKKFSFEPSEINLKKGETVTLTLHSNDATHGMVIEGLGVRIEAPKGQDKDITLTPQVTGTFQGKCAHFCGKGHGSMILTVHVVE